MIIPLPGEKGTYYDCAENPPEEAYNKYKILDALGLEDRDLAQVFSMEERVVRECDYMSPLAVCRVIDSLTHPYPRDILQTALQINDHQLSMAIGVSEWELRNYNFLSLSELEPISEFFLNRSEKRHSKRELRDWGVSPNDL